MQTDVRDGIHIVLEGIRGSFKMFPAYSRIQDQGRQSRHGGINQMNTLSISRVIMGV
jgi:hypothetical protein